MMVSAIHDDE